MAVMVIASATIALGFANYFSNIFPFAPNLVTALLLILILSFINYYGIKESVRLNVLFTLIEIFGLVLIIFLGMSYFGCVDYFEVPSIEAQKGFDLGMFGGILTAAALLFLHILALRMLQILQKKLAARGKIYPGH